MPTLKLRHVLLLAVANAVACSLGSRTVSLGGTEPIQPAGTSGGSSVGGATAGSADAGLNLGDGSVDVPCKEGTTTRLSGTVYDPAATTPLYNAVVYIPSTAGELPPFKDVISCEKCTDAVSAKRVALSGPDGNFVLDDVPSGSVDLVVQLGKWRRRTTIAGLKPCQENVISDPNLTRLPRTQSEGSIPKIALSTGHSDALECLLRKIGINDEEFTTDEGPGRVNLYVGCVSDAGDHFGANRFAARLGGQRFPSTAQLFDAGMLNHYDMVLFSCEGHKCDTMQTPTHIAQLVEYENSGGRVFLDHVHYNWLNHSNAPIQKAAHFESNEALDPLTTRIYTSAQAKSEGLRSGFPKGDAFAAWLLNVGASTKLGELLIHGGKNSCDALDHNRAQPWIYLPDYPAAGEDANFYFTIGTPVAAADDTPAPEACGRVVFTDLHVSDDGDTSDPNSDRSEDTIPFPDGCQSSVISAQERALEFMLFDLASCVQKETDAPAPPPLK